MKVLTHSLRAFAGSKGLGLIAALHELWWIAYGKRPQTDAEKLSIAQDLAHWRTTNELPTYAITALQHERLVQIEATARVGPQGFANFP